jgi:uncharacterized protein YxeA
MISFQKAIVIAAIILLIICLVIAGIFMVTGKNTAKWPPLIGNCPDYWEDTSSDGNGSRCVNKQNLGTCNLNQIGQPVTFMDSTTFTSNCEKYNWSKRCGVTWDGITYGVDSPCIKTK